jgi:hypothetical protein
MLLFFLSVAAENAQLFFLSAEASLFFGRFLQIFGDFPDGKREKRW